MADITSSQRKELPKSEFGLPGERKYPVDTRARAANAKARAAQQEEAGNLSAAEKARIDAKADKKLGKKATRGYNSGMISEKARKRMSEERGETMDSDENQ